MMTSDACDHHDLIIIPASSPLNHHEISSAFPVEVKMCRKPLNMVVLKKNISFPIEFPFKQSIQVAIWGKRLHKS